MTRYRSCQNRSKPDCSYLCSDKEVTARWKEQAAKASFFELRLVMAQRPASFIAGKRGQPRANAGSAHTPHREFLLRNGVGKECLWKKHILTHEIIQKQGKKFF